MLDRISYRFGKWRTWRDIFTVQKNGTGFEVQRKLFVKMIDDEKVGSAIADEYVGRDIDIAMREEYDP